MGFRVYRTLLRSSGSGCGIQMCEVNVCPWFKGQPPTVTLTSKTNEIDLRPLVPNSVLSSKDFSGHCELSGPILRC